VADPIIAFWDRPYRTVSAEVAPALIATITDPVIAALPLGIGSVEQWVDNADVLTRPDRRVTAAGTWRTPTPR
jgi:hypothetical protein